MFGIALSLVCLALTAAPADDLGRGLAALQLGDLDEAIRACEAAIAKDPKDTRAYMLRAHARSRKGRDVQVDLNEVIRLDPKNAGAYLCRGDYFIKGDNFESGLRDLRAALAIEPGNRKIEERLEEAEALAKKSREKSALSDRSLPLWTKAEAAEGRKDHAEVIRLCTEAIRIYPGDPDYYDTRGGALHATLEYEKAAADYTEAIRLVPGSSWYYSMRGNALENQTMYLRARDDYREAIRLDPMNSYAKAAIARCEQAIRSQIDAAAVAKKGAEDAALAHSEKYRALMLEYLDYRQKASQKDVIQEAERQDLAEAYQGMKDLFLKKPSAGATEGPAGETRRRIEALSSSRSGAVGGPTSRDAGAAASQAALRDDLERQILIEENKISEAERSDAANERANGAETERYRKRISELEAESAEYYRQGEKFKAAAAAAGSLTVDGFYREGSWKKPTDQAKQVRAKVLDLKLKLRDLK